jgi:hypothetical protein
LNRDVPFSSFQMSHTARAKGPIPAMVSAARESRKTYSSVHQ